VLKGAAIVVVKFKRFYILCLRLFVQAFQTYNCSPVKFSFCQFRRYFHLTKRSASISTWRKDPPLLSLCEKIRHYQTKVSISDRIFIPLFEVLLNVWAAGGCNMALTVSGLFPLCYRGSSEKVTLRTNRVGKSPRSVTYTPKELNMKIRGKEQSDA